MLLLAKINKLINFVNSTPRFYYYYNRHNRRSSETTMRLNNDSLNLVFDYLDIRDLNSFACTSKNSNEKKKQYNYRDPIIKNDNVNEFLAGLKVVTHFKSITIFEDIEDVSTLRQIFGKVSCTALHLHKSIIHIRSMDFIVHFAEKIRHISVFDGLLHTIDLSRFTLLNSVSITNHSDAEKVVRHLNKYKNITRFSLSDCPFGAHTELEDYVFGDSEVVETVYATYCLPFILELTVKNTIVVYNDITFELFVMMPEWFPNLKRLVLFDPLINPVSLKVMAKFDFLEYFKLQTDNLILKDVKFNKALKHLHLYAETVEIDDQVCNFNFKYLKISCNKLILLSNKPIKFIAELLYIESSNTKIYKYHNKWFKHCKYWNSINEEEAYSIISVFKQ